MATKVVKSGTMKAVRGGPGHMFGKQHAGPKKSGITGKAQTGDGGKWAKGATGPALGSVFQGTNKNGIRRWTTDVTIIAFEPHTLFEFAVTAGPLAVPKPRIRGLTTPRPKLSRHR